MSPGAMRLSQLVEVSRAVGATRSRRAKVEALTDGLADVDAELLPVVVAYLSGEPRQDRLDLGPAAVFGTEVGPADESTLTIAATDAAFQAIADTPTGTGSRTARIATLTELLSRATAAEQDWLRRLAVRDLRQGSLAGLLTAAIAAAAGVPEPAVRRAAMLSGDLRRTAVAALTEGLDGLQAFHLVVGTPLQPMLAATAASVADAMAEATSDAAAVEHPGDEERGGGRDAERGEERGGERGEERGGERGEVVIEAKLDGARVQVHRVAAGSGRREDDRVQVFTRNLGDVTDRMPEVVAAAFALPVTTVVLDGEALALDEDGRPRKFQDTMSRVGRERDLDDPAGDVPLSVRFFDVLHVDGEDVLDRPLAERLAVLARTVPAELRVDQLITADVAAAEAFLAATLAAGHEGVMVKALDASYEAGRRGASWRKVKPVHTLDLVVLAAEWGSGRRRGWLSNLHLGALAAADDPFDVEVASVGGQPDGRRFTMLGKTFKGLTDATLTWQTGALLDREVRRDGHVVHVRPELVVEIALDGFVRSTRYAGGLALRFARVRGYRPDKEPQDADTLATARAIFAGDRQPGAGDPTAAG